MCTIILHRILRYEIMSLVFRTYIVYTRSARTDEENNGKYIIIRRVVSAIPATARCACETYLPYIIIILSSTTFCDSPGTTMPALRRHIYLYYDTTIGVFTMV